ncbi:MULTISPECIES: class I SAM-dependent methyltransferase [Aquimarina]|uniref:class I SAM-dependent methyltransferase n=2 Tax=Flavobacteriaceae TaxID=49546 RepID=UPI000D696ED8|nr:MULTISPECIES: class I SAM-dependent methyltransferase [Aquimarina]
MKLTQDELKGIEKQLSNPEGEFGIEIAKNMNESNIQMTIDSIKSLKLLKSDFLLEIGHGNCGHLEKIYRDTNGVKYFGLEISETMKYEAERINKKLLQNNQISFYLYDGIKIPFPDNYFDKIFTVNTIYFWENPLDFIIEIYRVLKTNGILILTFAQKDFMKKLPFVKDKFSLYDNNDLKLLIKKTGFNIIETENMSEKIKSKSGELVERIYSVVKIKKL